MAASGVAVKLRRFRQRFGISAPRLAIRTHVAWYWRALSAIAVLSVSLALGAWIYDAGRNLSGMSGSAWQNESQKLSDELQNLNAELTNLRSQAGAAESTLQIERVAQQRLSLEVKALEAENAKLKQDLAFFEGLIPAPEGGAGVRISRLQIERESPGKYKYRMLLANSSERHARDFVGTLRLVLKVQQDGKNDTITLPFADDPNQEGYNIEFRNLRRVEGRFVLPETVVVMSVEARLVQDGDVRARQSVNL